MLLITLINSCFSSSDSSLLDITLLISIFDKLVVTVVVITSILSVLTANPLDISSVNLDNLLGATIDNTEPAIASISAIVIKTLKLLSSPNNLFIEPTKFFDLSGLPFIGPRLCIF